MLVLKSVFGKQFRSLLHERKPGYPSLLFPNICSSHKIFLEVEWPRSFYNTSVEPRPAESGGCKVTMRLIWDRELPENFWIRYEERNFGYQFWK